MIGAEEMMDEVGLPPLSGDEVDAALLVAASAAALRSDVAAGPSDGIAGATICEFFNATANLDAEAVARELSSVAADEAGRGCDVVVRVALLAVVEVAKPDIPGPTPIADERRSPKNANAAWSETSGSVELKSKVGLVSNPATTVLNNALLDDKKEDAVVERDDDELDEPLGGMLEDFATEFWVFVLFSSVWVLSSSSSSSSSSSFRLLAKVPRLSKTVCISATSGGSAPNSFMTSSKPLLRHPRSSKMLRISAPSRQESSYDGGGPGGFMSLKSSKI